jgi:hypothetical protein
VHRAWNVKEHPEWLVFEMEGGLQIRPAQHGVAAYMIDHLGSIVQLNMGEGKTRVILPMLILHWARGQELVSLVDAREGRVIRTPAAAAAAVCEFHVDA